MIEGAVSGNSEAIVRLTLPAATGAMQENEKTFTMEMYYRVQLRA